MFRKVILPIAVLLLLLIPSLIYFRQYSSDSSPLLSPASLLAPLTQIINPSSTTKPKKVVYGFLPYWNLKYSNYLHLDLLTHLAYFGIDYNADGSLQVRMDDGSLEPGLQKLTSSTVQDILAAARSHKTKNILTMRGMTMDIIEGIVNSPSNRQRAIQSTLKVLTENNFDGLNLDFEYAGTPDNNTKRNFTTFVHELSSACKLTLRGCEVSISVFADSGQKDRIWDFPALAPHLDLVVVMAYDYFRSSSTQAGPVSPLRGSCANRSGSAACLDSDISTHLGAISKLLPPEKILLGVPFYGYEWQTSTSGFLSNTYEDSGGIATYKRVKELLAQKDEPQPIHQNQKVFGIQTFWNDLTLTPYIVYEDKYHRIQQIHYEDTRSLSLKYDLVNQTNLAGIAIWALGYDAPYPDLWVQIKGKFSSK